MLRASHFSASYLSTTTIKFYLNAPFSTIRPLIASTPLLHCTFCQRKPRLDKKAQWKTQQGDFSKINSWFQLLIVKPDRVDCDAESKNNYVLRIGVGAARIYQAGGINVSSAPPTSLWAKWFYCFLGKQAGDLHNLLPPLLGDSGPPLWNHHTFACARFTRDFALKPPLARRFHKNCTRDPFFQSMGVAAKLYSRFERWPIVVVWIATA